MKTIAEDPIPLKRKWRNKEYLQIPKLQLNHILVQKDLKLKTTHVLL